jgi:hypothetical protein
MTSTRSTCTKSSWKPIFMPSSVSSPAVILALPLCPFSPSPLILLPLSLVPLLGCSRSAQTNPFLTPTSNLSSTKLFAASSTFTRPTSSIETSSREISWSTPIASSRSANLGSSLLSLDRTLDNRRVRKSTQCISCRADHLLFALGTSTMQICDFGLARGFAPGGDETKDGAGFMTECTFLSLPRRPIRKEEADMGWFTQTLQLDGIELPKSCSPLPTIPKPVRPLPFSLCLFLQVLLLLLTCPSSSSPSTCLIAYLSYRRCPLFAL